MSQSSPKSAKILQNRYQLQSQLGKGSSGTTYAAFDLSTEQTVAVKVLSLQQMQDWTKINLFDREVQTLQELNHPHIPKYIDNFQLETANNKYYCLVQELAPGKPLSVLIEEGWQATEETAKAIAQQGLQILTYLQTFTPPIIHRDIKPANIICELDAEDEQIIKNIYLVDFGAVQDVYNKTVIGGTVVGTYGYMAPEQFRGTATRASDLYSLGMTLLCALSRLQPDKFPQKRFKVQFRELIQVSPPFAHWLDRLLEPDSSDRFSSAVSALELLGNLSQFSPDKYQPKPESTTVKLVKTDQSLCITIPPTFSRSQFELKPYLLDLFWNVSFIPFWIMLTVLFPSLWVPSALISLVFLTDIFVNQPLVKKLCHTTIAIWIVVWLCRYVFLLQWGTYVAVDRFSGLFWGSGFICLLLAIFLTVVEWRRGSAISNLIPQWRILTVGLILVLLTSFWGRLLLLALVIGRIVKPKLWQKYSRIVSEWQRSPQISYLIFQWRIVNLGIIALIVSWNSAVGAMFLLFLAIGGIDIYYFAEKRYHLFQEFISPLEIHCTNQSLTLKTWYSRLSIGYADALTFSIPEQMRPSQPCTLNFHFQSDRFTTDKSVRSVQFGRLLTLPEKRWLTAELYRHIAQFQN
ncbi:serine/threonine-protein kinase [Nodularia spumigena CS-584]|uniref:serine/threonine-protein kinase n=1 Tax=Nodularia spumigena TaxID=70799 RepID=UPI0000EAAB76|nr:serine/threonine-protein kinase [Nodularia spumigena]AHJ30966.1 serine/threonine kinase [Nodularia spumigena CCY9414]EAW46385.1 serine/threonine kinase [Nodularia spumigena CCY9414]MDB9382763.1 serine/threonine-protein kinase [Nodularia spumigena CS-584]